MSPYDIEVDVLVIGAGGAGLAAACAAHDEGATVAIVEKLDRPGGNTRLSTGSIPGAGTRFQEAAGIQDDPERMIRDLAELSGSHDAMDLLHQLAHTSAGLVEWLADELNVEMHVIQDYRHVAHSVPRLHAPASRKGQDLVDDMVSAVERRDIPIALSNRAEELIVHDGAVTGALTRSASGAVSRIRAARTILSVNGFGANAELVARYIPDIAGVTYSGAMGSEGEAIRWGQSLGAQLGNMESYQGYACVLDPHGELLSWTTLEMGGIFVNPAGERFGDEASGYSGFMASVLRQQAPVHAIFDQRILNIAAREPWFKEVLDYGAARRADNIADLASALHVPADALESTLKAYNAAASGQDDDVYHRHAFGIAPLQAPYWYARVQPALLSTQGGLMVDAQARVLTRDGRPIGNLYAAGGAVAGIAGRHGGHGYASGSGLLHAIGLGRIAGLASARSLH